MTVTPIAAETSWETYAEAAVRLGITAEAVRAHAKRQRWPRQRPNSDPNGPVLVAIPPDFRPSRASMRPGYDPGQSGLLTGTAEAFRLALAQAEQRVVMAEAARVAAEARIDRAEARADRADQRADEAGQRVDKAEAQVGKLLKELEATRVEAQQARQAVEDLQRAEEARKARGRLRRAWDGWRGR
jgi:hypothetical protein